MQTPTSAATTRPLSDDQIESLRAILEGMRANGGSTRLERAPASLIRRGLVSKVSRGCTGVHGWPAAYTLTAAGMEIANRAEQARIERIEIRRSQRGNTGLCIG